MLLPVHVEEISNRLANLAPGVTDVSVLSGHLDPIHHFGWTVGSRSGKDKAILRRPVAQSFSRRFQLVFGGSHCQRRCVKRRTGRNGRNHLRIGHLQFLRLRGFTDGMPRWLLHGFYGQPRLRREMSQSQRHHSAQAV